jgi:hypothetical protein
MVKQANKAPAQANPDAKVVAALLAELARQPRVKGFKSIPIQGTSGRLTLNESPDGVRYFRWNNSPNPKKGFTIADEGRGLALLADAEIIAKAGRINALLNNERPTSHLKDVNSEGVSL